MDGMTWIALFLGALGCLAAKFLDNMTFHLRSGAAIIEARRHSDLEIIEIGIFEFRDLTCDFLYLPRSGVEKMRRLASINGREKAGQRYERRYVSQDRLPPKCETSLGHVGRTPAGKQKPPRDSGASPAVGRPPASTKVFRAAMALCRGPRANTAVPRLDACGSP